jgi:hypothetical protein
MNPKANVNQTKSKVSAQTMSEEIARIERQLSRLTKDRRELDRQSMRSAVAKLIARIAS